MAFANLVSAAVCQSTINRSILRDTGAVPDVQTFDAAAWVIFLSFWVMLYQILAIVQLFLRIEILYITVPIIDWSIFFLVVNQALVFNMLHGTVVLLLGQCMAGGLKRIKDNTLT